MSLLAVAVFGVHIVLLLLLSLFGLHRLSMVWRWFKYGRTQPQTPCEFEELPQITVQIPLFNEKFVAERIIDACAQLDYPEDRLQIQIVDDSTDDTKLLVANRVAHYHSQGINIVHCHRTNRHGFKAGALKDAMISATGEFIAIFDADFIPEPSTLKNAIHHFTESRVGMVQFRWGHLNRGSSMFTEAQAMLLDAHFALEQQVRYASGKLLNFNGTAGVWRKDAILDAGNWSADTLTEDLDLSYRAQLRGWEMRYLNELECPGEIPANMNAFKSQQHRWAKGGVQVMLKMLKTVWKAPLTISQKLESTFHLSNNLAYFVLLLDTIFFLIPSLWIREFYQIEYIFWLDLPLLLFASGGHLVYLFFGQVALGRSKLVAFMYIPRLMLLGIQLAFNNARAGLEALRGQDSEFVRTPKSGELKRSTNSSSVAKQLYDVVLPKSAAVELLVAFVYVIVMFWAISNQIWVMLPFLVLMIAGFMSTALSSFRSQLMLARNK